MRDNDFCPLTLIGEEIASAWNEAALADIARTFGGSYVAYGGVGEAELGGEALSTLDGFDCLIAAENLADAQSVYAFRPPRSGTPALIVGNEAKGLRRRSRKQAHVTVGIPLPSRNINCLNVSAAAAVMLYFFALEHALPFKRRSLASIQRNRPGVLVVGGSDHMELGSTLRSVCAFGWDHVFLDDRGDAWYDCDRRIKSEGRGTARRGRNPIKVLPYRAESLRDYRSAVVFSTRGDMAGCAPLPPNSGGLASWSDVRGVDVEPEFAGSIRGNGRMGCQQPLTGKDVLIVLQDESDGALPWAPPGDWRGDVRYASLPPVTPDRYHFRQMTAIALAEVARQLGEPTSDGIYLHGRRDRYRREMRPDETAPLLDLADLMLF